MSTILDPNHEAFGRPFYRPEVVGKTIQFIKINNPGPRP